MTRMYVRDEHGRNAFDYTVKELFGLDSKTKWPAEGMDTREIQGIQCWVRPFDPSSKRHRAMALCPQCYQPFTIGTLPQHSQVHEPKTLTVVAFNQKTGHQVNRTYVPVFGRKEARTLKRRGYDVVISEVAP